MILIVDDKAENIFSLKSILELNAFDTDSAASGEEALRKVLKRDYALIILDVQMPGMDGFEVAEAISSLNKTKDIPIIFLSAVSTHKRFVTKGFESGAVDYITKPVDPDILILKVRNFYRLYEKTRDLREAEQALTATVNELHITLESLPQIAFTSNERGEVEFVNQHWYGYSRSKAEFPETFPGDEPIKDQWQKTIRSSMPLESEVYIKGLLDDVYQYHLLRATPVEVNGRIIKWVGTFINIHEQKLLNDILEQRVAERTEELMEINKKLELTNHDLQQFASVASHDLKEPLRKIQVFGSMLRDKTHLEEPMSTYLDKILSSSERMSKLISDLLSFTRLSAADIFEMADINGIIDDILSDLELVIAEKKAIIKVHPIPRMEVIPGLLRQLFLNIIGNALKFSKPGVPPLIVITAELTDKMEGMENTEMGEYCRITIADNGIGFDEKYTEKIFTLFQRLNSREQYEGTGIGLSIAKKIVDKHNGIITAVSEPGNGARFIIILPVHHHSASPGQALTAIN
jgi:signal transduction histidine kinase